MTEITINYGQNPEKYLALVSSMPANSLHVVASPDGVYMAHDEVGRAVGSILVRRPDSWNWPNNSTRTSSRMKTIKLGIDKYLTDEQKDEMKGRQRYFTCDAQRGNIDVRVDISIGKAKYPFLWYIERNNNLLFNAHLIDALTTLVNDEITKKVMKKAVEVIEGVYSLDKKLKVTTSKSLMKKVQSEEDVYIILGDRAWRMELVDKADPTLAARYPDITREAAKMTKRAVDYHLEDIRRTRAEIGRVAKIREKQLNQTIRELKKKRGIELPSVEHVKRYRYRLARGSNNYLYAIASCVIVVDKVSMGNFDLLIPEKLIHRRPVDIAVIFKNIDGVYHMSNARLLRHSDGIPGPNIQTTGSICLGSFKMCDYKGRMTDSSFYKTMDNALNNVIELISTANLNSPYSTNQGWQEKLKNYFATKQKAAKAATTRAKSVKFENAKTKDIEKLLKPIVEYLVHFQWPDSVEERFVKEMLATRKRLEKELAERDAKKDDVDKKAIENMKKPKKAPKKKSTKKKSAASTTTTTTTDTASTQVQPPDDIWSTR